MLVVAKSRIQEDFDCSELDQTSVSSETQEMRGCATIKTKVTSLPEGVENKLSGFR